MHYGRDGKNSLPPAVAVFFGAHSQRGGMQDSRIEKEKLRSALKAKRRLLFAYFSKQPSNTRLAIEIRLLDDRISDLDIGLAKHRENSSGNLDCAAE